MDLIISAKTAAEYCGCQEETILWHIEVGNLKQNWDQTFDRTELDRWMRKKPEVRKIKIVTLLTDSFYG